MELLILGGLAFLLLLAAAADRGEPEVETFVITMPARPRTSNPLIPLALTLAMLLIAVALLGRFAAWLGM